MKTLLRGLGLGASVVVLASTTAFTAAAAPAPDNQRIEAATSDTAPMDTIAAMQRDLGLSPAQARTLVAQQVKAGDLDREIPPRLGADFAGSWFDAKSGKLVVAVTDARRVAEVQAAGAEARVVKYSKATLDGIKAELDAFTGPSKDRRTRTTRAKPAENRAAVAGLTGWYVDPTTNSVVVTVLKGQPRAAALDTLTKHGDAVRIEGTDTAPSTTTSYLDGGDQINIPWEDDVCSNGFNAHTSDGTRYLITAGHCGSDGGWINVNGVFFGTFVEVWFPEFDDMLVRNENPGEWYNGPFVTDFRGGGKIVTGSRNSPVGTSICKAGMTTRVTCGVIRATNETVTYRDDRTVYGLTRHTACVEAGDSGGSNYSASERPDFVYAEGITSGAQNRYAGDGQWRCNETGGYENVSWYFPIEASLSYYGQKFGLILSTY